MTGMLRKADMGDLTERKAVSCLPGCESGLSGSSNLAVVARQRPCRTDQGVDPIRGCLQRYNYAITLFCGKAAHSQRRDAGIFHNHADPNAELRDGITGVVDYEIDAPVHRLPASEIDIAVRKAIAELLADTDQTRKLACDIDPARIAGFINHCRKLSGEIADRPIAEVRAMLEKLRCAVKISADNISLSFHAAELLQSAGVEASDRKPISITIPSTLESWGHERRLRLDPPSSPSPLPDHHLVELIARSFVARDNLLGMSADEVNSMPVTGRRHLERIARLSYLAPNIISAILDGTQPRNLQARTLWRLSSLPLSWNEQHRVLGFAAV